MVFFNYEAIKQGAERVHGKVEAETLKEAREVLRQQGLTPLKIEQFGTVAKKTTQNKSKKKPKKLKIKKLKMRELIDFTATMYTFSKSGISIIESLFFIEVNTESKNIKALAIELRRQVLGGSNFSEALAKYPSIFDEIYLGLVKAGEESGELEKTLNRVIYLLDKQDKLRSKVISTLSYPVFVIVLAFLVTIVMLAFVFPAFKGMYSQMGSDLPFITKLFMDTGVFLKTNWYIIPLMLGSIGFSVYYMFTWEVSRRFLDKLSLEIPVFEKFIRFTSLANFIMAMRISFESGITMVDSLLFASLTVKNYALNDALKKVAVEVQFGQSFTNALKQSNVMPGIVMCMLATGEESGSLSEMLGQAADYIDDQVERIVDILSKLFEPLLFVIIGGIVLVLGLSLYLPLFQAYSKM